MLLSACLILRDESATVDACLQALAGVVDEVVVHDTGSVDDTVARARRAGALVVEGAWDDDFARARTVALERARGRWVFSVDADEVLTGAAGLREELAAAAADVRAFEVTVLNAGEGDSEYSFSPVRLFRRDGARWRGRVHERVEHPAGRTARLRTPVVLRHSGYAGADRLRSKGIRNAALARAQFGDVLADPERTAPQLAAAALDLGRASIGSGQTQAAVDAFETVRELLADGPVWAEATDFLTRLLLGAGEPEIALVLAGQLRAAGVRGDYCDWLTGQGLAQTRRPAEALAVLEGVTELVDPAGRRYAVAKVEALRGLCRELLAAG